MISWAIFYFEDLNQLKNYLIGMFGGQGIPLINYEALYYLLSYGVIFVLAAYFSTPHLKKVIQYTEKTTKKFVFVCATFAYVFVFIGCVAYLVDSTYNPFLYFRF
jgi:alginate O-acetyltransferase complex protein AlgI